MICSATGAFQRTLIRKFVHGEVKAIVHMWRAALSGTYLATAVVCTGISRSPIFSTSGPEFPCRLQR
jgi:hypothetical protein